MCKEVSCISLTAPLSRHPAVACPARVPPYQAKQSMIVDIFVFRTGEYKMRGREDSFLFWIVFCYQAPQQLCLCLESP